MATKESAFSLQSIQQEQQWRRWFPKVEIPLAEELDDATVEVLYQACVSFMQECCHIVVPGKRILVPLRQAQKEILRDWIKNRQTVSLKARQIGFSTLVALYALWLVMGGNDRNILMVSRNERDAIKLLMKAKYAYKFMPEWVRERGPKVWDRTKTTMSFTNDSRIESLPSANDPARGETAFVIVVDEMGKLPNPEEAWASIEPAAERGGRIIMIGTAQGQGNMFHKLWVNSQTKGGGPGSNFKGIFHPWWATEDRDQAWYDKQCANMEPWQRAQEYPSNPEEAFVGSGNPVFNLDNLRRFNEKTPVGDFSINAKSRSTVNIYEGGPFVIWEMPNDEEKWSYVVGADIAEGLEHGDNTVAWVICVQTNKPVAVWWGKIDPDVFGEEVLPAIGWYYRHAVIAPEVNNHGLTVLKALQRAGYQRIYMRRTFAKRSDRPLETMGWLTTATSKPLMIDELAAFLRETENVPHKQTLGELFAFRREANGRMNGSPHDDCVMALAIAVQARKYAITERIGGPLAPEKTRGTLAWWDKQLSKRDKQRVPMRGRI